MKILALESSAVACSAALSEDGKILAEVFQNSGLTHSRTLLPMVNSMLENCDQRLQDVDVIAVAVGPGSFTGLRIGVSTAKGLAWAEEKPCAPCSTLGSMAWQAAHMEGKLIVCAMDARRSQVYNALFMAKDGKPVRLTEDRAISVAELAQQLQAYPQEKVVVGDGAALCCRELPQRGVDVTPAPEHLRMQRACGVAREAWELAQRGELISGAQLVPVYHRLSQAERERMEREQKQVP